MSVYRETCYSPVGPANLMELGFCDYYNTAVLCGLLCCDEQFSIWLAKILGTRGLHEALLKLRLYFRLPVLLLLHISPLPSPSSWDNNQYAGSLRYEGIVVMKAAQNMLTIY